MTYNPSLLTLCAGRVDFRFLAGGVVSVGWTSETLRTELYIVLEDWVRLALELAFVLIVAYYLFLEATHPLAHADAKGHSLHHPPRQGGGCAELLCGRPARA